jgi:hypothetical protein
MAGSDELIERLAERANEAATRVHAATSEAKDRLKSQVLDARAAADKTTQELQAKAAASHDEASQRWSQIRQEWHDRIAEIKEKIDAEKEEHDVRRARRRAERAEDYAVAMIDFAYLTIEEAEYAVLDAALAHAEARDLAAAHA